MVNLIDVKRNIFERINQILEEKLQEKRKMIIAEQYESYEPELVIEKRTNNVQKMGRIKLIRIRVRKGKVQRRVKKSAVKGYEMKGGRLQRMSAMERMHRKRGARRAKIKRRSHKAQINRKLHISLRKRHNYGL